MPNVRRRVESHQHSREDEMTADCLSPLAVILPRFSLINWHVPNTLGVTGTLFNPTKEHVLAVVLDVTKEDGAIG